MRKFRVAILALGCFPYVVGNAAADSIPGDAEKGRILFSDPQTRTNCAACHGEDGKGHGRRSRSFRVRPQDFTDPDWQSSTPDGELFKAIKEGGSAVGLDRKMPAFGDRYSDDQLSDLVAYVRNLGGVDSPTRVGIERFSPEQEAGRVVRQNSPFPPRGRHRGVLGLSHYDHYL